MKMNKLENKYTYRFDVAIIICIMLSALLNTIIQAKYIKDILEYISSPIFDEIDKNLIIMYLYFNNFI